MERTADALEDVVGGHAGRPLAGVAATVLARCGRALGTAWAAWVEASPYLLSLYWFVGVPFGAGRVAR
jgi:hypothetical protein